MTIQALKEVCDKVVADGYGDCEVLFDTEAVCFDVHMVTVKSAYFESIPFKEGTVEFLSLGWDNEPCHMNKN